MNFSNKDNEKNRFFIICFVVLIILSIIVCVYAVKVIVSSENDDTDSSKKAAVTEISDESSTAETVSTKASETQQPLHESPKKMLFSSLGIEKSGINKILDKDKDKTYKIPLKEFMSQGDEAESFVFIVYSEDGVSDMGELKGGFGISVNADCKAATSDNWYQSEDFSVVTNGAYCEVTWTLPEEIKDSIDINGQVMFGYWWSDIQTIRLSSAVCNKSCLREEPVDGERSLDVNQTANYESSPQIAVPLNKLISDKDKPESFTISVSSGGNLGKFTCSLGMSQKDADELRLDNVVMFVEGNRIQITWILPDDKSYIPDVNGSFVLYYWWSDCKDITMTDISVRYSNDGTTGSVVRDDTGEEASPDTQAAAAANEMTATAADIVSRINVGWNLGNSLDVYDAESETGWGNPKTTKQTIDTVKNAGFNTIRIPVTWSDHLNGSQIDAAWLERVREVADYAVSNEMYVIINMHHDDMVWLDPTYSQRDEDTKTFSAVWKQIAEKFKDYDEHLLFEGLNEPRVVGSPGEWNGGTDEERDVINGYLDTFVQTVRSTGGNNTYRCLIVTTQAASITETALNGLSLPSDDRLIVSIHSYSPWEFAGTDEKCTDTDWGTDQDKKNLDSEFDRLKDKFVSRGIPVIIGEFGADFKNNDTDRARYYEYYIKSAKARNIKCIVWDNGNKDEFGLLDREHNTWFNNQIIESIMNGAK
ncbi:MAG: cellulase family glycosylhydrolase [Oscillospiraceae bacterium]|nr:cellulase family glycosylhydrolase [Oscillospiraceae bacterium]